MVKHVYGDLLEGDVDIIAHQVNCQGVMGSGVARQIRAAYPGVFRMYRKVCTDHKNVFSTTSQMLGMNQYVHVSYNKRPFVVANLFAQDHYGRDGRPYTDYNALRQCLLGLRRYVTEVLPTGARIGMPYKIGCGRGGGDWENVVYPCIVEIFDGMDLTLFEYREEGDC